MKKRIISLTLAVVMLFSCLTLNVFATETAGGTETATSDTHTHDFDYSSKSGTGTIPSVDEIGTMADEVIKATGFSADVPMGGLFIGDNAATIKSANDGNGDYYITYSQNAKSAYAQVVVFGDEYDKSVWGDGRKQMAEHYGTYRGKTYTVTMDLMLEDTFAQTDSISLFNVMSYTKGANDATSISGVNYFVPLTLDCATKEIYYSNNGEKTATGCVLDTEKWYTISVQHTPATNSYDFYFNGNRIVNDATALSASDATGMYWSSSQLSYANIDYPADAPVDASGKKMFKVDGPKDFTPIFIRFSALAPAADAISLDNIKTYYDDDYLECKHEFTTSAACDWCGKVEKFFDYSSKSGSGTIPTIDEIGTMADDLIYATDFAGGTPNTSAEYANQSLTEYFYSPSIYLGISGKTVDNNRYMQYQKANSAVYMQIQAFKNFDGRTSTAQNYGTYRGKTYTFTFNFKLEETFAETSNITLLQIMSYTKSTDNCTTISGANSFFPLQLSPAGEILYLDGSTYTSSGTTLEKGTWYTISVQHTPKDNTFDAYVDGNQIAKNKTALSASAATGMYWSSSALTYEDIDYPADANGVFTVNGPQDFVPTYVRFPNFQPSAVAFGIDDVKFYFDDEYLECKHKFTTSNTCDWCGKVETFNSSNYCDICDGVVISKDAAVVAKSVSLGELIDMNLYVKVPGSKSGVATLTCGDRTETFNIAELEADAEGKYKLSLPLTSILMVENVTLTLDGGTYTTSVKEYAEELIASSESDSVKALAKALLNYGAAAQEYFAVKNSADTLDDILANAGLEDADKVVEELTAADLAAYKFSATGMTDDVRYTGATLTFSSKTYMKVYFTASADATVTVNGKSYAKTEDNGQYYVTVTAATPAEAMTAFEFVITDGETVASADISVFTAVHAGLANSATDADLVDLIIAYARYCELASAYVANK